MPRSNPGSPDDPVTLQEPNDKDQVDLDNSVWMRGLFMLIFAILFSIAQGVLVAVAVLQFLWMLFARKDNEFVRSFGADLGQWMQDVARFQSVASEDMPFPWRPWGRTD